MRIRIYSDLHLEFDRFDAAFMQRGTEELVVLAGDIDVGIAGVHWAAKTFDHVPVAYVLGNHEYYHHEWDTLVDQCREAARGTNVHVLERDALDIGGIRVLGCTLWTDFALFGAEHRLRAEEWAERAVHDFKVIRHIDGSRLAAETTVNAFTESAQWLEQQINASDRPLLVVTHHAPTERTIDPSFVGRLSSAAFHSDLDRLLRPPVRMWVHGHTHYNTHALVKRVNVVTNQWGYPAEGVTGFRKDGLFEFPLGRCP